MEKELAILIADLSGYTALTEVHGAASAAQIIEQLLSIVRESLVGDSRLHERAGDEVMIVAEHPEDLAATALLLRRNSLRKNKFLLVHGGLHQGTLLYHNGSYFGAAINFASRIAAKAPPGSIWCSAAFRNTIKTDTRFISRGAFSFKNMEGQWEVFELADDAAGFLALDPVCRMVLVSGEEAIAHPVLENVYFCSAGCLAIYEAKRS